MNEFTIFSIQNGDSAGFPQIDGDNIVWAGDDGNDNEIFFYNGDETVRVTDNSVDDFTPAIDGNNVV